MKLAYLLLCLIPSLAVADIYKKVDADGHVTYSSAPIKGGKVVILTPPAPETRARASSNPSPGDFPKVNQETQRGRDSTRRNILEEELKTEEGLLNIARQAQQLAETAKPRDEAKVKSLSKQVELHQGNIDALKVEISKLK
ncbi:MAG: DUF4124 domain-containing protein [Gallionella sp.]|nr:DUF4124 domain-containing protein [Gallionella sp.]